MILTCNVLANFKSRKKVEKIIEAIFGEEECNLKTKTIHPTGNYKKCQNLLDRMTYLRS